jgi:predicted nuclease of predicted toxin-antitoxin system
MAKFLIDANLPYHFSLWNSVDFIHVADIDDTWSDEVIWKYAKDNDLIIISKDSDFSNKIIIASPPPRVIHIKVGNMRIRELHEFLNKNWKRISNISQEFKLTNVYISKIEGIK